MIEENREQMRKGFTLVEIMIVVAIIGIIMAIAVPAYLRSRETSRATACQANLKQLFSAKENWGNEVGAASGEQPKAEYIYGPDKFIVSTPQCPAGGKYKLNILGDNPTCSIGTTLGQKKWYHVLNQDYPNAQ